MNYKLLLKEITTFVFDVDGVLTDGTVLALPNQEPIRSFNSKDGYALQLAVRKGYKVAIITGGKSQAVKERLEGLGVKDIWLGASNKIEALEELTIMYGIESKNIAYMGDDIPDYEVLKQVGLSTCPKDAAPEIRGICRYISPINGGKGCVRDLIEQVLKIQGNWMKKEDIIW